VSAAGRLAVGGDGVPGDSPAVAPDEIEPLVPRARGAERSTDVRVTEDRSGVVGPDVGEPESFDSFYGREQRRTVALAYALCGDASVAEEITHDAFIEALARWDHVGAMVAPDAWVRAVVANRATSRFRRLAVESRALLRLRSQRQEDHLDDLNDAAYVWAAVRRLPRRQAQVIALIYVLDLSRRDAALVLKCSEETVKTHLERARRTLAAVLQESEGEA
jgi:RNA polymerase sigma-70 factor (ECF subfamily)